MKSKLMHVDPTAPIKLSWQRPEPLVVCERLDWFHRCPLTLSSSTWDQTRLFDQKMTFWPSVLQPSRCRHKIALSTFTSSRGQVLLKQSANSSSFHTQHKKPKAKPINQKRKSSTSKPKDKKTKKTKGSQSHRTKQVRGILKRQRKFRFPRHETADT